jgi:hypothetical protein
MKSKIRNMLFAFLNDALTWVVVICSFCDHKVTERVMANCLPAVLVIKYSPKLINYIRFVGAAWTWISRALFRDSHEICIPVPQPIRTTVAAGFFLALTDI